MYKIPSIILRYGVITGLILTILGVIVKQLLNMNIVVMLGLVVIVSVPLVSLFAIGILLMLRKDIYGFLLSQLAIIIILAFIIISLCTK